MSTIKEDEVYWKWRPKNCLSFNW